jgi:hypothetical protein
LHDVAVLRRLDIHGFRGFATLSAELGPVSVLLGPNSSGKSTVLQAVRLACSALAWTLQQAPVPKLDGDWIVIWWDWPIREDAAFLPSVQIDELFLNKGDEPFTITLGFEDTDYIQEVRISMRYARNAALKLDVRVKSSDALAAVAGTRSKSTRLAEALAGKEPIAVVIPSFYGVVRDEPYLNNARLERMLGAGEQGSVVRNLVGRLDKLNELNDLLRLSVGAEIVRSTSGQALEEVEALEVHFRDRNGELELSAAGTGLVALTALFSALKRYQPRATGRPLLLLLDEPEAHLHPKLQGDTGDRLAEVVTNFAGQALIATHSVEMVNRLGRRADTVLLSVDRAAAEPAVRLTTENEIMDRLSSFCDLSPFAGLQLLRSRRVLFHEGKTDRAVLEACARAAFANAPARLENFRRWTFVELSSETNADAKDVLKKALAPLAATGAGGDPVRIVRVLDRDYHRAPVLGPEQGTADLKEYDVVWSRHSIESLFLDPACLAAWIRFSLDGRPHAPSLPDLEQWVADGIASANTDAALCQTAVDQVFPILLRRLNVGELDSNKSLVDARRDAEARVRAEPAVYQNGKQRARHVLAVVRSRLHVSLQNRVRADVADILRHAPSPSTLGAPALIPPDIDELLRYLAT